MAKKLFIERLLEAAHTESEKVDGIGLAFSDCLKYITNVCIRLAKEGKK